jgi:quercetin dioxygenase-like cupin family protein
MQSQNNKFFVGRFNEPNDYRGWFIGDFIKEGDVRKTDKFEILYMENKAGAIFDSHLHKEKVELLIILEGKAKYKVNDQEVLLEKGSYLYIDAGNVISGEFLEDSKVFVIHSPSIPTDKILV